MFKAVTDGGAVIRGRRLRASGARLRAARGLATDLSSILPSSSTAIAAPMPIAAIAPARGESMTDRAEGTAALPQGALPDSLAAGRRPRVLLVGFMPPTKGGVTTFMLNLMGSHLNGEFEFVP